MFRASEEIRLMSSDVSGETVGIFEAAEAFSVKAKV